MIGYGLGQSAFTTASHITLVLVLVGVFHEAQRVIATQDNIRRILETTYVRWSVFAVFSSLILERLYYTCARLLLRFDVNIWQKHPAPELLSAFIGLSLFSVSVAGHVATAESAPKAFGLYATRLAMMIAVYAVIVVALY